MAEMLEAKVSWLLYLGRLVSKIDNVMHFARLVKQASVDYWHSFTTGQSVKTFRFFLMKGIWNFEP